ncbi:hypothetical protein PENARI_c010G12381 [Penicillium arizonense]|uniref:Uncharacterized protein n=1 Tax=Penicillium arizonense TaxID=1835702 RepID=A0A1F5LHD5_PENAI|nr:hypothetical protein PENARI_c010G12381 [Penicillium arizonense]OGE52361.1 hypothetical protein PENARI_c010G12381 [Penicillium arizonense]
MAKILRGNTCIEFYSFTRKCSGGFRLDLQSFGPAEPKICMR